MRFVTASIKYLRALAERVCTSGKQLAKPSCSHGKAAIVYSDGACAIERCPDCGNQVIYGRP